MRLAAKSQLDRNVSLHEFGKIGAHRVTRPSSITNPAQQYAVRTW